MDTQQPTVTLTREHRDAIRDDIELIFSGAGDLRFYLRRAKDPAEADNARELLWRLEVCTRLLDQLGWQRHADQDTYRLDVDADVARFMEWFGERAREDLLAERADWPHLTDEDQRESARRIIDADLDAVDAARLVREAFAT
jgi:hypothetical protein